MCADTYNSIIAARGGRIPQSLRRAAAAIACVALLALPAVAATDARSPAPDFKLSGPNGSSVSLSQYRGQVVMINFWASWCGPCRTEMPILESIHRKYKSLGFTMLAVNVEPDSNAADKWLKTTPVSFPVGYDRDSKVSKLYKVEGMPSTIIVDRHGNTRVLHRGYKPGDENEYLDHIRALLREK